MRICCFGVKLWNISEYFRLYPVDIANWIEVGEKCYIHDRIEWTETFAMKVSDVVTATGVPTHFSVTPTLSNTPNNGIQYISFC